MSRERIPADVRKLAKELAQARPMRRGSVSERFMKCGQKECRCQHDQQARHGPYYSVTRVEGGKTRSRYLSAEQAVLVRQQVEAGQEFRRQLALIAKSSKHENAKQPHWAQARSSCWGTRSPPL